LRAVCGGRPKPRNVAGTHRKMQNRSRPRGKAHHRSDTLLFQKMTVMSKAALAPSVMHRRLKHSLRQRSGLAAFGSNTSTRAAPIPAFFPDVVRTRAPSNPPFQKGPNLGE